MKKDELNESGRSGAVNRDSEASDVIMLKAQRRYVNDILNAFTDSVANELPQDEMEELFTFLSSNGEQAGKVAKGMLSSLMTQLPKQSVVGYAPHEEGVISMPKVVDYNQMLTTFEAVKCVDKVKTANSIKNWIKSNKLNGIRDLENDNYRIPAWQFYGGRRIDGVDEVLQLLGVNGAEANSYFVLELAEYDGKCIVDFLREGNLIRARKIAGMFAKDKNETF